VRDVPWIVAIVASVAAIVLGFDGAGALAVVVALFVRQLTPNRLAPIGLALISLAIAVTSAAPLAVGASCAVAFGLLVREYTLLVSAQIVASAGWGPRPRGVDPVVIEGALAGYLFAGRPEHVLVVLAACCAAWAVVVAVASGLAISRREAGGPRRPPRARLGWRARWARLGEGARSVRDPAFWGTVVARPMARVALQPVADLPWVTPNRITAVSVVCCAAAAALIVGGVETSLAIVLIGARSVLDSMDGQLARYRAAGSQLGSYVDKVSDQFCWAALYAALAVRAFAAEPARAMLVLPLMTGAWFALASVASWLVRPSSTPASPPVPWAS
jgi:hypothetical protein